MKIAQILVVVLAIILTGRCYSQSVGINDDGSNPNPSAILDLKSINKGLLVPRLTTVQIQAIENPADGLIVYNTSTKTLYVFILGDYVWKGFSLIGTINPNANFAIGAGEACSNTSVSGSIRQNEYLTSSEFITIEVDVTSLGSYSIETDHVNGYSFSKYGVFTSTGIQTVNINGNGKPILAQTDNFTATGSIDGGTCTFPVTVAFTPLVPTVYNPVTGKTWMDRNLGATRVANSSTDASAYGYRLQWGRALDGHQGTGTTSTIATTPLPNAGNSWDGLFILSGISPNDWLLPQDNNLWQGVTGTNNPCPEGFRIPTEAEWEAERLSWTSNDPVGAFASPLKIPIAGNRSYSNGTVTYGTGNYWSSTVSNQGAVRLLLMEGYANIAAANARATGFSIRCIKD